MRQKACGYAFQPGHLFGSDFCTHPEGCIVPRRNWKQVRPNSAIDALRLCKEYAQEKKNLSIERIADRMGVTHDSLYKWLSSGKLPFNLLLAYELACGCHFASEWAAASSGKVVINIRSEEHTS